MKNVAGLMLVLGMLLSGCMSLESRLKSDDYQTRKEAEIELYRLACETHDKDQVWKAIKQVTCDEVLAQIAAEMVMESDMLKVAGLMAKSSWIATFILDCPRESVAKELVVRLDQKDVVKVYNGTKYKGVKVACLNSLHSLQQLPYDKLMSLEMASITNRAVFRKVLENDFLAIDATHRKLILDVLVECAQRDKGVQISIARAYKQNFSSLSESNRWIMCRAISDAGLIKELISESISKGKVVKYESHKKDEIRLVLEKIAREREEKRDSLERAEWQEEHWHFLKAKEYRETADRHEQNIKRLETQIKCLEMELKQSVHVYMYLEDAESRRFFIKNMTLADKSKVAKDFIKSIVIGIDYFWCDRIAGLSDCAGNEEKAMIASEVLSSIDDKDMAAKLANELFDKYNRAGVKQKSLSALANGNLDALIEEDVPDEKVVETALACWEDEEVDLLSKSFTLMRDNDTVRKVLLTRIQRKIDLVDKALPIAKEKFSRLVRSCLIERRNTLASLKQTLEK